MTLPDDSHYDLAPDMRICRLLNGMWQVSGAHGPIDPGAAVRGMFDYLDAGLNTWDLADHYGPAEDFIGSSGGRLNRLADPMGHQRSRPSPSGFPDRAP